VGAKVGGQMAGNLAVNFLLGAYGLMMKNRTHHDSLPRAFERLRKIELAANWTSTERAMSPRLARRTQKNLRLVES